MKVLPENITRLIKTYQDSQSKLIDIIAKSELKGNSTVYRKAVLADVNQELKALDKFSAKWVAEEIPASYGSGAEKAYEAYRKANIKVGDVAINEKVLKNLVNNATGQLQDATEYVGRRIADDLRQAGLEAIAEKLSAGDTVKQTKANLLKKLSENGITAIRDKNGREISLDSYASTVARTTTREATNKGSINAVQDMGGDLVQITSHYSTCPICVTGNTIVSGPKSNLGIRREYSGDLVSISTAAGNNLTGTPEHSILTPKGWCMLKDIKPGDEVLREIDVNRWLACAGIKPNNIQVKSRIDDLCESFSPVLSMDCFASPSRSDFDNNILKNMTVYGSLNSKVNIVRTDSGLMLKLYATISKLFCNNQFINRTRFGFLCPTNGTVNFGSFSMMASSPCNMGGFSKIIPKFFSRIFISDNGSIFRFFRAFFKGRIFPPCSKSTRNRSSSYASTLKIITNNSSTHSIRNAKLRGCFAFFVTISKCLGLFLRQNFMIIRAKCVSFFNPLSDPWDADIKGGRQLFRALASSVTRDKIIDVNVDTFTGHVYDLQTNSHWYVANNIITHNCSVYEGRIYSISGNDTRYPKLDEAFSGGYSTIHPNCTHSATVYIEEFDDNAEQQRKESNRPFTIDKDKKASIEAYNRDQAKKTLRRYDRNLWEEAKILAPNETPGTFSAFRSMKKADSERYQQIKIAMEKVKP